MADYAVCAHLVGFRLRNIAHRQKHVDGRLGLHPDKVTVQQLESDEELTVTGSTTFGETALPYGSYAMVFELRDITGNYTCSDAVTFDCANGEI